MTPVASAGLQDARPTTSRGSFVEIACDESGFSGTNLLDPATPVLTHASVDLAVPEATEVLAVLRSGPHPRSDPRPHPRSEYKSARLLRPDQRPALDWFVRALHGRAQVVVVDKAGFVAARVLELFADEPTYGAGTRLGHDHGDAVRTLRGRTAFLAAFVDLTRGTRPRLVDHGAVDRFFATMPADVPALRGVTVARVEDVMARLVQRDPAFPPPLEPMVPALAETLLRWSAGRRSVAVVHDEQSALTPARVARLGAFLERETAPGPAPLRSFVQADSRGDPRVQVADLLAGIARRRAGVSGAVPFSPGSPAPGRSSAPTGGAR